MNWAVVLPVVASIATVFGTLGAAVIVGRYTNAGKREDRTSAEIQFLVNELQEELALARVEIRELRLEIRGLREEHKKELLLEQQRGDLLLREKEALRVRLEGIERQIREGAD